MTLFSHDGGFLFSHRTKENNVMTIDKYAYPEVLVTTDWPLEHLHDSKIRFVEVDVDTTLVFYGDTNNWSAAYTFWLVKYYDHKDARLMNGVPLYPKSNYAFAKPNPDFRVTREYILGLIRKANKGLVDVRSADE